MKRKDNNQFPDCWHNCSVLTCSVQKCANPGFTARGWTLALRELAAWSGAQELGNPSIAGGGCDQGEPRTWWEPRALAPDPD